MVLVPASSAFYIQMPNIVGPKIEQPAQMPIGCMGLEEEEEANDEPPAGKKRKLVG